MDANVYPDFDIDAELMRAKSSAAYHLAQAHYYETQVKHLIDAKAEQMEIERDWLTGDAGPVDLDATEATEDTATISESMVFSDQIELLSEPVSPGLGVLSSAIEQELSQSTDTEYSL